MATTTALRWRAGGRCDLQLTITLAIAGSLRTPAASRRHPPAALARRLEHRGSKSTLALAPTGTTYLRAANGTAPERSLGCDSHCAPRRNRVKGAPRGYLRAGDRDAVRPGCEAQTGARGRETAPQQYESEPHPRAAGKERKRPGIVQPAPARERRTLGRAPRVTPRSRSGVEPQVVAFPSQPDRVRQAIEGRGFDRGGT